VASLRHAKVAIGDDNPDRQVSVSHWNAQHTLTGTANYLIGYDGAGSATDVNPATLVVGAATQQVATRTALAALSTTAPAAYLRESGREGMFVWSSSNNATNVTNDPGQAIYVPPASDSTGASGAWVRRYSGAKSAKWFGATGDGTTDDNIALQRWLDSGGYLHLPVSEYYSSDNLILRKNAVVEGAGYGFDSRIVDATADLGYDDQPGAKIRFAVAKGFSVEPQSSVTDETTSPAAVQEGAAFSAISNLALVGAGTGASATGLYCRTVAHFTNVHVRKFQGKGFDISAASGPASDTTAEYGAANGASLTKCVAIYNGSHGFHIRGVDANVIKIDSCSAQLNGGWGFLDDGLIGNTYINCQAATNTSGGFKATNAAAQHTYTGCFVETGTGNNCDLRESYVVTGGSLATLAMSSSNAAALFPQVLAANYANFNYAKFTSAWGSPGAITNGYIYRHADTGLTVQGAGATYDVSLKNKSDQLVLGISTGTKQTRLFGETMIDFANLVINGDSTFPGLIATVGRLWTTATNGLMMAGYGSTYDACLANHSGNVALRVPTATTNVEIVGTVSASNLSGTNTGDQYTSLAGLSVVGRSANTSGAAAAITAVTDGHVLRLSGTTLGFGTVAAAAMPALTGDVTTSAGAVATTIGNNIVTYAKFQQVAASSLVGNATGSLANAGGITLAGGLAFSGTTLTAAGALTPTSVASTGAVTSSSATAGIGYATGAGGAVTQLTSKSTAPPSINKVCGQITMNNAALAAGAKVSFTVSNTSCAATDGPYVWVVSGGTANAYRANVTAVAASSFTVTVENITAGSLSEAPVIGFFINKAVTA
jgi:hypothetical protein